MDGVAVVEAGVNNQDDPITTSAAVSTTSKGVIKNNFQGAISAWRAIGFADLIARLDTTATDLVEHQKDAVVERKEVAQKTKDFRKLDDAGKLVEYKSLLKAYQGFVDLLTNHGKASSAAFLQLYAAISEAPDPFPLLEAAVEAQVVEEEVVPRLTNENQGLQERIARLSCELEIAEARLQTEVQAREEAENGSSRRIETVEASWRTVIQEKEDNWAVKEKALEEKIEGQDRLFKELKANYEVAQRLGQDEQDAAAQKAASAELRAVTTDLERTSRRLTDMEARNEQLSIQLAQAKAQYSQNQNDDSQVLRLQSENSSLLRKIDSLKFDKDGEKRKAEDQYRHLERQHKSTTDAVQDLKKRLQRWSDYDEIRRELQMLRSIELSADDDNLDEDGVIDGSTEPEKKESLEQLLLARNKKLSNDLTLLRVSHKELVEQLDDLKVELHSSTTELEKSQKLTTRLENDIERLQEEAADGIRSSAMSVAGTYTSRHPGSMRRGRASPTSSIISGFDGPSRGSTLDSLRGEPMGGGSGILPMVQAQRDRFKQKTQQLEEELQKTYATVTSLRQEVASLQKDNLNLYEKSRYISGYSRNSASSSAYGQVTTNMPMDAVDDGTGDKWRSQYEANISPFAAFRGREATRAFKRMTFPERVIFSLTRVVLATRTSRNLFAGYCLALHLLVVLMLYWMSAANAATAHMGGAVSKAVAINAAALNDALKQDGLG